MKKKIMSIVLALLMICQFATVTIATVSAEAAETECAHEYEDVAVLKQGTCDTLGIKKQVCSECDKAIYVQFYGHTYENTVIDATCTEPAKVGEVCSKCDAVGVTEDVEDSEALGHDWVLDEENEDYVAAECGKAGNDTFKCSRCPETKAEATDALEHVWEDIGVVEADCANPAGVKQVCALCEEARVLPFEGELADPAKDHTPKEVEDIEASCKDTGWAGKVICSACGEVLEEGAVVEKTTDHDFKAVADVAATCKKTGLTGKTVCSICGEVGYEGDVVEVDPTAHKTKLTSTLKAATCETTGIGKYTCEYCGAVSYKIIDAGHVEDDGVVTKEATCGKAGEKVYTCTICDKETRKETIEATGKHTMVETTIDATCDAPAKVGEKCSVCDAEGITTVVEGSEALGHDLVLDTKNKNYKAATCDKAGNDTFKCSRCDYTKAEATEALGHDYDDGVHQDATCDDASGVLYTCATCGDTYVDAYPEDIAEPKLGHKPEAVADIAATCKTAGWTGKTVCKVCGEVVDEGTEVEIDADAHKFSKLVSTLKAATCEKTGIGKYSCEYCDATAYKIITLTCVWDEGVVTKEATCGDKGEKTFTCTICGETKKEDIAATGEHTMEETFIDATCEAPAKAGEKCTVCGAEGETEDVEGSEALGHDLVLDTKNKNYKAATCDKAGNDTFKCSRCDYTKAEATEALGHAWEDKDVVEADCTTAAGVKQECANCGKTQIVEFEGELAGAKKEHTPKEVADVEATCKATGWAGKVICSVCGEVLEEGAKVDINADAHKEKLVSTLKEATCDTNGIGKYACELCDKNLGYKVIPALGHEWDGVDHMKVEDDTLIIYNVCEVCGDINVIEEFEGYEGCVEHTEVIDEAVEATCTEPGLTEGKHCSVCGEVLVPQEPVDATGHAWDEGVVTTKPTIDAEGVKTFTCTVCGETDEEPIEKLDHEHVYTAVVTDPTCTEAGYTTYTCECGDSYTDDEVDALGHTEEADEAVEATCSKTGLTAGSHCSVCGEVIVAQEVVEIDALAHTWDDGVVTTLPTDDVAGVMTYTCSGCGETREESVVHDFDTVVVKPTCTTDGYTSHTCSNCGDEYRDNIIEATGHNYKYTMINGKLVKVCTVCDHTN